MAGENNFNVVMQKANNATVVRFWTVFTNYWCI